MTTNRNLRDAAATPKAELLDLLEDLVREDVPFLEAENLSRENDQARVKLPYSLLVQFLMLALTVFQSDIFPDLF